MAKLTKRQIEALQPDTKDYFVWDAELSGFGIRVFPTGRKQFVMQYRYTRRCWLSMCRGEPQHWQCLPA